VASTSNKGQSADQELVELQHALLTSPTVDAPHNEPNPEVRETFMQRRVAQREAYGQFVAIEDVYDPDGNIVVFTKGQAVPIEHVEKWQLEDVGMVTRVASADEARTAFRPTSGPSSLLGSVKGDEKPAAVSKSATSGKES
jgi:hypothetical protein